TWSSFSVSHACHPGFAPGYPFGPQGKDGGDPTLARHTIALQIDDPSPATAGAIKAPAVVHFLPENLHLHKTSRSSRGRFVKGLSIRFGARGRAHAVGCNGEGRWRSLPRGRSVDRSGIRKSSGSGQHGSLYWLPCPICWRSDRGPTV